MKFGVGLVVTAGIGLGLSACQASPPQVILYGDSASGPNQSGALFDYFVTNDGQAQAVNNVFAGTGPCQWLPQMQADAGDGVMSVAVLEFSGDAFGCEAYAPDSPSYFSAYQSQVTQAAQMFSNAGVHTFLIGTPMPWSAVQSQDPQWDRLNEIYAQIAATVPNTTFVNAGAAVEQNGQFAWSLPCLSFEPYCGPGGTNPVRAPDGGHFCPLDPNSINCGDYSSGGVRFALAEAYAVNEFLATGSAPSYEGPPLPPSGTPAQLAPGQWDPYFGGHDMLAQDQVLGVGQSLRSLDGRFTAVLQNDGNFVCYGPGGPMWSTNTTGSGAWGLVMQSDGNLVLYGPGGALWSTSTSGPGPFTLAMQNDGNLVAYGPTGPIWSG